MYQLKLFTETVTEDQRRNISGFTTLQVKKQGLKNS